MCIGFSNRSTAKLKPGAVPTVEPINLTTNARTNKCERVNTAMSFGINTDQGQLGKGFSKRLASVADRETSAIKIVNETLAFEEGNIPVTIIKKFSVAAAELQASKVPILETCDIKIENEEVTVPTIETTVIKKEIEAYSHEDSSVPPELQQAIVPSNAMSAVKIENETNKCKIEISSKRNDIKIDSREIIGFKNQTATHTETSAIKLEGETFTCQHANIPATAAVVPQGSREQQPKTLEFIVFVPYRVQIRDPSF